MKNSIIEEPKHWVVLRRGILVYVGEGETSDLQELNAKENQLFNYEVVEHVTDAQLFELENKSEFYNPEL